MKLRIKPLNYNLSLFDLEFGGKWAYSGLIKIYSKITEQTDKIVINTKELEIQSAEVFSEDGNCMCTSRTQREATLLLGMVLISI